MTQAKHLLKAWVEGYAKSECGKLVPEKDMTLIAENVTCGLCMKSLGYKRLKRGRPFRRRM